MTGSGQETGMRRPSPKLLLIFLVSIGAGYGLAFLMMSFVLQVTTREFSFWWLTTVAILFAMLLIFILDGPLELHTFDWPEEPEQKEPSPTEQVPQHTEAPIQGTTDILPPQQDAPSSAAFSFPYETQAEHWEVDFSDSKETYEGADLPIWLLAGWAAFIIWAVVYLISGLPGAF